MFTHPRHRGNGHGSLLMAWGMSLADTMNLEVLSEASAMGRPLYAKFGLKTIDKVGVDTTITNPSNTWKRLESNFGNWVMWWMWKPAHGIYEEGVTPLPWVADGKP